jgi:hypothetical protein
VEDIDVVVELVVVELEVGVIEVVEVVLLVLVVVELEVGVVEVVEVVLLVLVVLDDELLEVDKLVTIRSLKAASI